LGERKPQREECLEKSLRVTISKGGGSVLREVGRGGSLEKEGDVRRKKSSRDDK